jgi:hypothetical protein
LAARRGDGVRRCPLYRGGCHRQPRRLGPTVVARSGKVPRCPHPRPDRWRWPYRSGPRRLDDMLSPWPTAVGSIRCGPRWWMYIFDKFQNGRINLQIGIQKYKKLLCYYYPERQEKVGYHSLNFHPCKVKSNMLYF